MRGVFVEWVSCQLTEHGAKVAPFALSSARKMYLKSETKKQLLLIRTHVFTVKCANICALNLRFLPIRRISNYGRKNQGSSARQ